MSIGTDICRTQSYSFDPTNCDDPVNPGVQDITNSKKSSWKIPSVRKLFTGALALQAASMAPKANAGDIGECLRACEMARNPTEKTICVIACMLFT